MSRVRVVIAFVLGAGIGVVLGAYWCARDDVVSELDS